ncbi:hypothetical protein A33Q_0694 [Indibacter alkaliphilus LW1]|uniref:Uncharacterized protein n=1 Tax=Indibacter alkaliphilus (strain CCUG 57479 / KCTC 22604 / LW1) TaxID=1189612 RepID=S2E430_INDAL|nr:hypothetical protein A33Q_0694 [Indibacter alkaliphilus LW1]
MAFEQVFLEFTGLIGRDQRGAQWSKACVNAIDRLAIGYDFFNRSSTGFNFFPCFRAENAFYVSIGDAEGDGGGEVFLGVLEGLHKFLAKAQRRSFSGLVLR